MRLDAYAVLGLLVLGGCATTNVPYTQKPVPAGMASIVMYRVTASKGLLSCPAYRINQQAPRALPNGSFVRVLVPAGEVSFDAATSWCYAAPLAFKVQVERGTEIYLSHHFAEFREPAPMWRAVTPGQDPGWVGLSRVPRNEALEALKDLREAQ